MIRRALTPAVLVAALAVPSFAVAPAAGKAPRLSAFNSCTSLVKYGNRYKSRAGIPMRGMPVGVMPMPMAAEDRSSAGAAPSPAAAPTAGVDYSATNVQEAGVDEPDILKTDGKTVFALARNRLRAVDVSGAQAKALDSLPISGADGAQLLLRGDRVLVMAPHYAPAQPQTARAASSPAIYAGEQSTILTEVDVSDPAAMKVLRTLTVDGTMLTARLNGRSARIVINTLPRLAPESAPGTRPTAGAAAKRRTGRRSQRWLPHGVLRNRSGRRSRRAMVACRAVKRTPQFSGVGMLTVLTVDMDKGLPAVDSDSIMTDAETVYASGGTLYAATRKWSRPDQPDGQGDVPNKVATTIHSFDISETGVTRYRASGVVPGYLLSQWSMSEHEGVLRVASTTTPTWWGPGQGAVGESLVSTLRETSGLLAPVGVVGGLGKGERIYAVRFIGDVGYVVTFRQTDPLYTIDVSDPARPTVLGELKILGYSAYLHPVGEGLLLGIGQDATEEGMRTGAQVSLFDVSDLRNPRRVQAYALGSRGSSTEAEYDHHAFLWWGPANLAVFPLQSYENSDAPNSGSASGPDGDPSGPGRSFNGALALRVTRDGIAEAGRITHPGAEWAATIRRSLVAGPKLFTFSDAGLKGSDLGTLGDASWVGFE